MTQTTPPNLYELVQRLDASHNALAADLRAFIARADERCKGHDKRTESVEKTVYGNGVPGLKTRVDRLETRMYMVGAIVGIIMPIVYIVLEKAWK